MSHEAVALPTAYIITLTGDSMFSSKWVRVTVSLLVIMAGLWLVFSTSGPAAETIARQEAIQAFAPINPDREGVSGPVSAVASPVVVNLKDIPAGVYDPNNQYDRWLRGEIDLDEVEGMRSSAELAALREAALKLEPSSSIDIAQNVFSPLAPALGVSFDGIDYNECCGGGGNVPPDPELAVGPNHVIAVVNVAFKIYDTNGNLLVGPTTFASFMASNPACTGVFDPNANYDESADRYILGIDADGTDYCVAVSQTGDPTGAWNIYAFHTVNNNREFFDYPHAGVGRDALYMGANIFRGNSFLQARVYAFDKAAMYAGTPAAMVTRSLANIEDTPQPLNLHGWNQGTWPSSGPHYFITETNYNGRNYTVFSWNAPFGANTFATVGTMDLQTATGVTAGLPVNVPQSGSSGLLQGNDYRPQDFEYRNGFGWTVQTISCNPGSGTVNCIRWAQINLSNATVANAGVYASNGEYRFFGDLAANHCNDMAVGYTKSSSSMFPGVWYTGRLSSDAAGTLQPEAQLKAGEITYTAFDSSPRRWGDYTEMTVAPDGVTFWYLGEYSKDTGTTSGRWGTYIGSFSFAGCDPGDPIPTPTPQPTPSPTAPPSNSMHVGDLDRATTSGGNRWRALVTIKVENSGHAVISGATVNGTWSGGINSSGSCVTSASGTCTITSPNINNNQPSVTFTVTNVSHGSYVYTSGDNHDPDGDSNGTAITVLKP